MNGVKPLRLLGMFRKKENFRKLAITDICTNPKRNETF